MTPPKHELVVRDCDEAIKLDSKYVKALNRRAIALEHLERYQEALRGKFTVLRYLHRFEQRYIVFRLHGSNNLRPFQKFINSRGGRTGFESFGFAESERNYASQSPSVHAARRNILTILSRIVNQDYLRLHSFQPILLHSDRVRCAPLPYPNPLLPFLLGQHPQLPDSPSTGDNTLQLALDALDAADYPHAVSFVNEAMEQGISSEDGKAEAYNLRGTFRCVISTIC